LRSPPRLIAATFMVFILSFFPLLLFILFYKSFCCLYLELQPASCLHISVVCQCHNLAIALDLPKNNYCSVHPFSSKRLRLESIFSLILVQETVEIPDWQPGLLFYNAAPRSVVSSDIIVMYPGWHFCSNVPMILMTYWFYNLFSWGYTRLFVQ
jgi:hypothetical protein